MVPDQTRALLVCHDALVMMVRYVCERLSEADVLVCIGAANRDPSVFPHPDVFDLRRANANQHLSFGSGPHLCLGAPLARLEARVVLEELAAALPGLRLAPAQTYVFMPIIGFRGPRAIEVEWD